MDALKREGKIKFNVEEGMEKKDLELQLDVQSSQSASIKDSNVTSPQFVNSPSSYHSLSAYKNLPNQSSNVSSGSSNSSANCQVDNANLMASYQQNANNVQQQQPVVAMPYVLNSVGN